MNRLLESESGRIIISVIWGLGLAFCFFQQTCNGPDCIVFKAPSKEVQSNTYIHDAKCYQFQPYSVKCRNDSTNTYNSSPSISAYNV